jgi:precorrin-8X/cobalt-precorrin-8 methylmutase
MTTQDYIRDGAAIYARSFSIIRAEADLAGLSAEEERVAVRIIHACGMVDIVRDLVMSPKFAASASSALKNGAPILCDSMMVADGVTRARLPARNEVICTLRDPRVTQIASDIGNTRTAAAMELWRPLIAGSLVVVGNAPTALFRLMEMLDEGVAKPAAVIGMPVGFVGAAESKDALAADARIPYAIIKGRKGGSAMAAAAVNALASEAE